MKEIFEFNANIVGVVSHDGDKGWIQPINFEGDKYKIYCAAFLEKGNSWGLFDFNQLDKYLFSGDGLEFRVFEFDNPEELFNWLAGNIETPAPKVKKNLKLVIRFKYPIHGDFNCGQKTRIVAVEEEGDNYYFGTDYSDVDAKPKKFLKDKVIGRVENLN